MTKLRNRTVLLTSCSSALGYAFAVQLAQKGANFVLWDRDLNLVQRIAGELTRLYGVTATPYQVDLRNKGQIDAATRRVTLEVLHVHVVIHASDELVTTTQAGVAHQHSIADKDERQIAAAMQHHTLASLWLVKSLLPVMIEGKEGGHFVFLSSSVTLLGASSGIVDYAASKYALLGLTRSLQHELQRLAPEIRLTTVLAPLETSKMPSSMSVGTTKKGLGHGWMKPDLIAMHTIDAIKRNKRELVLPKALGFVRALCALLPQTWADSLLDQMKYSKTSDALT
uniref:Ketoreductase domain-containing protein n=1 Tax=Globisporangium ultimum (strain ATCC 200006 / CBS 805.95 / DAOM BR144) TaxID=431595 RepID=K3XC33_GLOUD